MKMTLKELKQKIAETVHYMGEEIAVDADGTIDLADPTIIWNDLYNLEDQPSFIKYAIASINYDLPPTDDEYGVDVDQQTRALLGSNKRVKQPVKKTSYGNDTEWAIDRYAKNVSKYPHKVKESLYDTAEYGNEREKTRHMDRAGMLASQNPHFDPNDHILSAKLHGSLAKKQQNRAVAAMKSGNTDKAQYHIGKASMHKDTSMGHAYAAKLVKNTKSTPKAVDESAAKGWEGTIKAMKRDKKKGKNNIDNPYALINYMKKKGNVSHYNKKGEKKK